MIILMIVLMSAGYFQSDINPIQYYILVSQSELTKPILKFLITI